MNDANVKKTPSVSMPALMQSQTSSTTRLNSFSDGGRSEFSMCCTAFVKPLLSPGGVAAFSPAVVVAAMYWSVIAWKIICAQVAVNNETVLLSLHMRLETSVGQ